ncbi:hypothetical protein ACSLBF_14165 [Pseudoalteromonas sp. T1lg65]|uniref:hypothetical protein n=1 Tax=Pseudoalteromonas sp. T1lg65 TaxID=2077101 RepID=UPI003F798251
MKNSLTVISLCFVIFGCANTNSPELNQCAQQNYQCESNCELQTTAGTLSHSVCTDKCVEAFNQCKEQAELLKKASQNN